MRKSIVILLPLALLLATVVQAAEPVGRRDLRVHDPSTLVRDADGTWWLFGTGRLILSASSPDLLNWKRRDNALRAAPPWAAEVAPGNKRAHYWAPDVIKVGGRYLLYYSVSEFGKNTSAIGLATSPGLDPKRTGNVWTDRGIVIRSGPKDDFNAIDPSLLFYEGRLWMAFGSFWDGIFLVELDPETGLRLNPDAPPVKLASAPEIEAPTLHRKGDFYYLFVNHGYCCRGKDSTYRVVVGRSRSVTGPYLDDKGRDLRNGGGRAFLGTQGSLIGPGHVGIVKNGGTEWVSVHFYDGTRDGTPHLALRRLVWTADGWPRVAD